MTITIPRLKLIKLAFASVPIVFAALGIGDMKVAIGIIAGYLYGEFA